MSFLPCGQVLVIDSVPYRVAEHPAVTGYPYGQEGRQGTVYQLVSEESGAGGLRALKVFKPWHRRPGLVSLGHRMKPFATLGALSVCRRTVVTPQQHQALLQAHPDLLYAVIMPWVEGPTWMEVMLDRRPLTPEQCLGFARTLTSALTDMEQHILAHCDLSGANLLLPGLVPGATDQWAVALVDVEQIYGPGLDRPEALPGGSSGYAHKGATEGLWASNADRFAGAILLAEILGWSDERIRSSAWGETYFDVHEMPTGVPGRAEGDTERYELLYEVLNDRYGSGVAGLLDRAWRSENLAECATFGEWLMSLPSPAPKSARTTPTPLQLTVRSAMEREEQGRLPEALALYQAAYHMSEAGSEVKAELEAAIRELEALLTPKAPEPVRSPAPAVQPSLSPADTAITVIAAPRITPLPPPGGRHMGVTQVAFCRDSATLAAAGRDGTIRLWSATDGRALATIQPPRPGSLSIAFSPVDDLLAGGGAGGSVYFWDPCSGSLAGVLPAASADLSAIAFGPGGDLLAVGACDGTISICHTAQREIAARFTMKGAVTALTFSPDGTILAAASRESVALWQPGGAATAASGGAAAVAFHSDGETVYAGGLDGSVRRYRTAGLKLIGRLPGHTSAVTSVAIAAGGDLLASGSADRTVRLWSTEGGSVVSILRGHLHPVTGVSFSPDCTRLSSCSYEGVRLWGVR